MSDGSEYELSSPQSLVYQDFAGCFLPLDIVVETEPIYKSPNGADISVKGVFSFLDSAGDFISAGEILNSGSYRMNGCVVLEVTDKKSEETSRYLMYKDISGALRYRIQPRPITLVSAAASKSYDSTPLIAGTVEASTTATGPVFPGEEGLEYYFSADAFRMTPGTTDNSFTYTFKNGTDPQNYFIAVQYGTLTVR